MIGLARGDLVTIAIGGDYGKPRPALVIQSDAFSELPSVTVLRFSTTITLAPLTRLTVEPSAENGLRHISQIMIDKVIAIPREKVGKTIGRLDETTMSAVNRSLTVFLGLEDVKA